MERGKTRPRSDDDFVSLSSLVFFRINTILFKRKRDYRFYITLLRAATSSRTCCCCCSQRESEKESTNTHSRRKEKRRRRFCEGFLTSDLPLVFSLFFYFFEKRGKGEREECALFLPCVFWSDKAKEEGDFDLRETLSSV